MSRRRHAASGHFNESSIHRDRIGRFAPTGASTAMAKVKVTRVNDGEIGFTPAPGKNIGLTPIPVGKKLIPGKLSKAQLQKVLAENELSILHEGTEYGVAFTADGEHIISKKGKDDVVEWSPAERKAMGGGTLTHNHPNGSCFSNADLMFGHKNGLGELRAVGERGEPPPPKKYRYIMRPDSKFSEIDRGELEDALDLAYTHIRKAVAKRSRNRPISENEDLSEYGHYQMELLQKILKRDHGVDLGYSREEIAA